MYKPSTRQDSSRMFTARLPTIRISVVPYLATYPVMHLMLPTSSTPTLWTDRRLWKH